MRVYVASAWRNTRQTDVVEMLRVDGYEVYDFKNPHPDDRGFYWNDIDPRWPTWTTAQCRDALHHPLAVARFQADWQAMLAADVGVLVLPCGASAHIEAGYFVGAGKPLYILLSASPPELMYNMATACCLTIGELLTQLATHRVGP